MKLNIGAGKYPLKGFENLDLPAFDMLRIPWAYAADTIDMIVMGHVLEHVPRKDALKVIREVKRVLKPGGLVHIGVPDMDRFIDALVEDDQRLLKLFPYQSMDSLLGGGEKEPHPEMRHRYVWSLGSLWYELHRAGFTDIEAVSFGEYDNPTTRHWSLQVEARA